MSDTPTEETTLTPAVAGATVALAFIREAGKAIEAGDFKTATARYMQATRLLFAVITKQAKDHADYVENVAAFAEEVAAISPKAGG